MQNELSRKHKQIGQKVRRYREQRGLSQEELAWKIGLSTSYMGQLERGERNLNVDKILKIAKALKVNPSELLKGV
jgi:XRE family transcriptional regulator, regulator of sulfur utilization